MRRVSRLFAVIVVSVVAYSTGTPSTSARIVLNCVTVGESYEKWGIEVTNTCGFPVYVAIVEVSYGGTEAICYKFDPGQKRSKHNSKPVNYWERVVNAYNTNEECTMNAR